MLISLFRPDFLLSILLTFKPIRRGLLACLPATLLILTDCFLFSGAKAYKPILRGHPEQYTILGTVSQTSVTYRQQELWIGNNVSIPTSQCDLGMIVMCNREAQRILLKRNLV